MQVLAIRHSPLESLGYIERALRLRGVQFVYLDLWLDQDAPARLDQAGGLVILGGSMSANDNLPYISKELDILEQALATGIPTLGVCLGAQLIAKALGSRVYRNAVKEIGFAPVFWKPEACYDRLLAGLVEPETVMHWHGETLDLPSGSAWLAHSQCCRHQAFRYGSGVWGLQFHLEATPEMIGEWLRQDESSGSERDVGIAVDPQANRDRLEELAALIFGRWLDLVGERATACA